MVWAIIFQQVSFFHLLMKVSLTKEHSHKSNVTDKPLRVLKDELVLIFNFNFFHLANLLLLKYSTYRAIVMNPPYGLPKEVCY